MAEQVIPFDLDKVEEYLPEPARTYFREARETLVSSLYFNLDHVEDEGEKNREATDYSDKVLWGIGLARAISPEFWGLYQSAYAGPGGGIVWKALEEAAAWTPHLSLLKGPTDPITGETTWTLPEAPKETPQ